MGPYIKLTSTENNANLNSGISSYQFPYPYAEGHFADILQSSGATLYSGSTQIVNPTSGIFDRQGLISPFSSGPRSRNYAITNFKETNPYRHYVVSSPPAAMNTAGITIMPSSLIMQSTYNFNVYSKQFRT